MSESEDDEIFDDEEISDSEHSGSIKDDEMGSEFNESGQLKSPKNNDGEDEEDDFADPSSKKEPETNAKGEFVTVPVSGMTPMRSPDGKEMSPSGRKDFGMEEEEMEEMYEQDLGKLNWQEIFLEEKMSGEP